MMFCGEPNFPIQGSSGNGTLPRYTFEFLLGGAVCARPLVVALYLGRQRLQSRRILLQLLIRCPAMIDGIAEADRVGGKVDDLEDIRDQAEDLNARQLRCWKDLQDSGSPHGASGGVAGLAKSLVRRSKLLQFDHGHQSRVGVDEVMAQLMTWKRGRQSPSQFPCAARLRQPGCCRRTGHGCFGLNIPTQPKWHYRPTFRPSISP